MGQAVKPGTKWNSTVCQTQIMALRVPGGDLELTCGGVDMSTKEPAERGATDGDLSSGTLVGKRYVDEGETMEFLCTRGGDGTIQVNGISLGIKEAKKLPSSD
jgi:hypothetical protein